MSGGLVRQVDMDGTSNFVLRSGTITEFVVARDGAQFTMSGGSIGTVASLGGTTVSQISSGTIGQLVIPNAFAVVTISGGTLIGGMSTRDNSVTTILGGDVGPDLEAINFSTVTIFGSSFNLPLGPIAQTSGNLTGVLADGASIAVSFTRATTATIILAAATDSDGDGVADGLDNCLDVQNPDQADTDGNGLGDACNDAEDFDGDEFADNLDNCPDDSNGDQVDSDLDPEPR